MFYQKTIVDINEAKNCHFCTKRLISNLKAVLKTNYLEKD